MRSYCSPTTRRPAAALSLFTVSPWRPGGESDQKRESSKFCYDRKTLYSSVISGAPEEIRTPDPQIRRLMQVFRFSRNFCKPTTFDATKYQGLTRHLQTESGPFLAYISTERPKRLRECAVIPSGVLNFACPQKQRRPARRDCAPRGAHRRACCQDGKLPQVHPCLADRHGGRRLCARRNAPRRNPVRSRRNGGGGRGVTRRHCRVGFKRQHRSPRRRRCRCLRKLDDEEC
jgi:hypothetical protein